MSANELMIFKLSTGDEIVATAQDVGNAFICTDTLQIVAYPDEQTGQMRMMITQFMPYMKDEFILNKASVVAFGYPAEAIAEQYNQKFGKIHVPEKKLILDPKA